MDYEKAKAQKLELEGAVKRASDVLQTYPRGPMGLTPDDIKATDDWKAANAAYWRAHDTLREFNGIFNRRFKKEIQRDRKNRY